MNPTPLAAGSVSLRLYAAALDAEAILEELCAQAATGARAGFDGVMFAEHHGGFGAYLPNPVQLAGFALDVMERGWAAAQRATGFARKRADAGAILPDALSLVPCVQHLTAARAAANFQGESFRVLAHKVAQLPMAVKARVEVRPNLQ